MNAKTWFYIIVIGGILLLVLLQLPQYSTPTVEGAKSAVEAAGYTNVVVGESDPWKADVQCNADGESFFFPVTAVGQDGKQVKLHVCAGYSKGYAIRTDKVQP